MSGIIQNLCIYRFAVIEWLTTYSPFHIINPATGIETDKEQGMDRYELKTGAVH